MEGVVENAGELVGWATDKYFDSGWERSRKFINGKKVESVYRPLPAVAREQQQQQQRAKSEAARSKHASASSASSQDPREPKERHSAASASKGRPSRLRSPDYDRGAGRTAQSRPPPPPPSNYYPDPVSAERRGNTAQPKTQVATLPASRRKQANLLVPARTDFFTDDHANSTALVKRLNEDNDEVLRAYEAEKDDPPRNPASVLPEKDLWTLAKYDGDSKKHVDKSEKKSSKQPSTTGSRRDSAMASGYNDDYRGNTQYPGEPRARSAQPPPRHRYDDDDDSDYDERSGRRDRGGARGYSDRDRDDGDYYEVHERYRGPVSAGPLVVRHRSYPMGWSISMR